jgi:cytidyltransferase-like protein
MRSLFIGRYQPLHAGHIKLIRSVLNEGRDVVVALRDTRKDESNPYSIKERQDMFNNAFNDEINSGRIIVISIPDIDEVCYGRKVGWGIREIKLDADTESISATAIRNGDKK